MTSLIACIRGMHEWRSHAMKIATWNVNSIRARHDRLLAWLERYEPDVLCLQELKVTEDVFPYQAVTDAGYVASVFGQKTYNGVAILSRSEPTTVIRGMGDGDADPQARLITVDIGGVTVISAYVPNGKEVGDEKYAYKLEWLSRLREFLAASFSPDSPVILCGDLNVAPDDDDVAHPDQWADSVLCHQDARDALGRIMDWGLVDVFAAHNPDRGVYSWWDYRRLAFPKNDGLRIDHVLATSTMAERCSAASIDRDERKGDKPSDHAPVIAEFDR